MPDGSPARFFVFETTHHAMWAEDVAREQAIPVDVVPAPPEGGAKCGIALRTPEPHVDELTEALDQERILYRILQG
jgi:hypothetical protein